MCYVKQKNITVDTIKTENSSIRFIIRQKISDIGLLMKFKLSLTVVFSALLACLIAADTKVHWYYLVLLFLGGMLTSGAANGLNQVLEKDYDKLMKRTQDRPLVVGRMSISEGVLISGFMALIGISLLALINPITAFIGMLSLIMYSFIYTPMKRVSNIAVFIGAFPGAFPIIIGCSAIEGTLTSLGLSLFMLQFIWQFPHFNAIAWLGDEDYKAAGFNMLPTNDGIKDKRVGEYSMFWSIALIPFSMLPYALGVTGIISVVLLVIYALLLAYYCWQLYRKCSKEAARNQMFASLLYLPMMLLTLYFDKIV